MKSYSCGICGTPRVQLSHHRSHLKSEKHLLTKEAFRLRLAQMDVDARRMTYFTSDVDDIVKNTQTQEFTKEGELVNDMRMLKAKNISNKEALRDKIHEIHNFLRNTGIGYGMNALKTFTVFYGLMRIEESGFFEGLGLPKECKFSYLVDLAKKNEHGFLTSMIIDKVLGAIHENEQIKPFLFYEIPADKKERTYGDLVLHINDLKNIEKSCGVQLSGKIYEYFIGRDDTAISELGAYFTDRHIVDFINQEEPPHVDENGHVSTMIDPFGGSGGFTVSYIMALQEQNPDLDWSKEINNIYHYDMNEDVVKSAALEMFCLTGAMPNMITNVACRNSFTTDFGGRNFKHIRTNPPYGGDKTKQTDTQKKNAKILDRLKKELAAPERIEPSKLETKKVQYRKLESDKAKDKKRTDKMKVSMDTSGPRLQRFAKKHKLKGNDKESVSLMLLMDLLDEGGTAVGVLKEGVFFNKTYKDLRAFLIKNYNVRKVISVPSDQFENTTTKTSIIVFDNTPEKTTQVEFSQLVVEKCDEDVFEEGEDGLVMLVECEGDVKNVVKNVVAVADVKQLKENDWSLNGKDYTKKNIVAGEGYEVTPLSKLCVMTKGTALSKKKCVQGPYPVIGGGKTPSAYHNQFNRPPNTILCSASGNSAGYISWYDVPVWASDCFSIQSEDPVIANYLYYFLKSQQDAIYCLSNGSVQPHVYPKDMAKFGVCVPKSRKKMVEWVEKISKPFREMNEKKKQLEELHKHIVEQVDHTIHNEECVEHRIGDVCKFVAGKYNRKDMKGSGDYPFYNSNTIAPIGFHDSYCFDGDRYCVFTKDGGNLKNKVSDTHSLALPKLMSGKIACTNGVIKIETALDPYYVYFQLLTLRPVIQDRANYTVGLGHVDMDHLKSLHLRIPKVDNLNEVFQQYTTLKDEVSSLQTLYEDLIQDLARDAIKSV